MQCIPKCFVPSLHAFGFFDESLMQLRRVVEAIGEIAHSHCDVLHEDLQVELPLSSTKTRM
jgi:hypothetical protein